MENKTIRKLSWPAIVDIIMSARVEVRLVLPSVHQEWVDLLEKVVSKGVDVKICVSNAEKPIREGLGDDVAVDKLLKLGISINETKPNRIALIYVDNRGFLYFPISKIFEDTTTDAGVTNAVLLDYFSAVSILSSFFPEDINKLNDSISVSSMTIEEIIRAKIDGTRRVLNLADTSSIATPFDIKKFREIQAILKNDPPVEPDLRRMIDVYNLKVQFVELRFENGRILGRRVAIPKKALPFESLELRRIIDAGMKLFSEDGFSISDTLGSYSSFQERVRKIREKYLVPIKCRPEKSILQKDKKSLFLKEVEELNSDIRIIRSKLAQDLSKEIDAARGRLSRELTQFFMKNPPKEVLNQRLTKNEWEEKCYLYVKNILRQMKFPDPNNMVDSMKLHWHFYDLTWNDLSDQELLEEFWRKNILKNDLESIREISKVFKTKK